MCLQITAYDVALGYPALDDTSFQAHLLSKWEASDPQDDLQKA